MYPLSSEHSPGTNSPILMCEGDVNRGPLKNDISISMLIMGYAEKKCVFLKSWMGHHSSKKDTQGFRSSPRREHGARLGAVLGGPELPRLHTPPA